MNIPTARTTWVPAGFFHYVLHESFVVEHAPMYDFETEDFRPLLKYIDRNRWHGTREYTTNVCMVARRGGEEDYLVRFVIKNRCYDGYVGEVSALCPVLADYKGVW